jgi:hypothetical protein
VFDWRRGVNRSLRSAICASAARAHCPEHIAEHRTISSGISGGGKPFKRSSSAQALRGAGGMWRGWRSSSASALAVGDDDDRPC